MTRRPTAKRAPRLRSDAVIPPEKYMKVPPFLDALVFVFACFLGALADVVNAKLPFLDRVVARIQYRAALYLGGIRWYNIDRLVFGGAAMLIDLVLWDFLQPVVELVVTTMWVAAVPWRDAPLSSVFTRHSIVKTRIQLAIDNTTAFFAWPFTLNVCESAAKLYQRMNQDPVALRRAKKASKWCDAQTHFDFAGYIQWKTRLDAKAYRILIDSSSDASEGVQGIQANFSTSILDTDAIIYERQDLVDFLKCNHYEGPPLLPLLHHRPTMKWKSTRLKWRNEGNEHPTDKNAAEPRHLHEQQRNDRLS